MSLLRCPVQYIHLEVESPKHECLFGDYHANLAPQKIALVDEKVQSCLPNGLAMVKNLLAKMVDVATKTRKALVQPFVESLDLATP